MVALGCDPAPRHTAKPQPVAAAVPPSPSPPLPPSPPSLPSLPPAVVPAAPSGGTAAGVGYVEALTGGARADETLPLVVAIHGLGDTPEAFIALYTGIRARARVVALRGTDPWGPGFAWFTPGGDRADGIRSAADRVTAAMAEIARQRPVCGLPIVTGFSQGGMVAYALAARSPSVVRAAVPLGGMLPEALRPVPRDVGGLLPEVHGLHGEADPRVPVSAALQTVAWFRAAGFAATLGTEPGVGHTVSPTMRSNVDDYLFRVARCP